MSDYERHAKATRAAVAETTRAAEAAMTKRNDKPCPRGDKLATIVWNICVEGDEQGWVSGLPPDARQRLDKAVNDYCV